MKRIHKILEQIRTAPISRWLEREGNIPTNTIAKHYGWVDKNRTGIEFPARYGPNLIRAICKISGIADVDNFSIGTDGIAYWAIKEYRVETVWDEGVSTYISHQQREIFDVQEFVEWLQKEAEQ